MCSAAILCCVRLEATKLRWYNISHSIHKSSKSIDQFQSPRKRVTLEAHEDDIDDEMSNTISDLDLIQLLITRHQLTMRCMQIYRFNTGYTDYLRLELIFRRFSKRHC